MPPRSALDGLPRIPASESVRPSTIASVIPLTYGGAHGSRLRPLTSSGVRAGELSSLLEGGSTARSMMNLLPLPHHSLKSPADGIYLGEGVPPVPEKLTVKIRKGEFVEMGELLLEFWSP